MCFNAKLISSSLQALLNITSWNLHKLTDGHSLIRDVQVHLPQSWSIRACLRPSQTGLTVRNAAPSSTGAPKATADILVGSTGFGGLSGPYAEQHGGCGHLGLRVHLPISFVMDSEEHMLSQRGKKVTTKEISNIPNNCMGFVLIVLMLVPPKAVLSSRCVGPWNQCK